MRVGRGRNLVLAVPGRVFAQRFGYAMLACAAITLMILSQAEPRVVETIRVGVVDTVAPIFAFFSQPAATIASGFDELDGIMTVHERNEQLAHDNAELRKWQAVAEQLGYENEMFRRMLKVVPDQRARFVTARVIADSGGPFIHMVLVNAGQSHGVRKGQAVVNHDGLVGRVLEAGDHTARILLLTDLNSRIPVVLEESRDRTILRGDNSPHPYLAFLATDARAKPGDRVVTSGEGGMFPPALDVGIVSAVDKDRATVQPFVVWERLDYVTVLDYVVPGVLPETRRAERAGSLR